MKTPRFAALAATGLILSAPAGAFASLTYDLRLNDDNLNGVVSYPGEVIKLDLFARVTGSTSGVEGFQEGYGSVIGTTSGGITGGLSATLADPFAATGAQPGHANDLNGDSVMDLGGNQTVASSDFVFARAQTMSTTGTSILGGQAMEFKLATVFFKVDGSQPLVAGSTLNISFRVTDFTPPTGIEALWMQDGTMMVSSAGGNAPLPTVMGNGVTLTTIPEPTSAALLGLGAAAGCLVRRRNTGLRQKG